MPNTPTTAQPQRDQSTTQISIRPPAWLWRAIRVAAASRDMSGSALVIQVLEEFVETETESR